jgi:hypothetical protein
MKNLVSKVLLGIFTIVSFAGCTVETDDNIATDCDYVAYGTSVGECMGYCKQSVNISEQKLICKKEGWNSEGALQPIEQSKNNTSTDWAILVEKIDIDSFLQLPSVIGCPDCADGGAEWIEIKLGSVTHKVVFEYGNEPETVKAYISLLRANLGAFATVD